MNISSHGYGLKPVLTISGLFGRAGIARGRALFYEFKPAFVVFGVAAVAVTSTVLTSKWLGERHIKAILKDDKRPATASNKFYGFVHPSWHHSWTFYPHFEQLSIVGKEAKRELQDDHVTDVDSFSEPFWADF